MVNSRQLATQRIQSVAHRDWFARGPRRGVGAARSACGAKRCAIARFADRGVLLLRRLRRSGCLTTGALRSWSESARPDRLDQPMHVLGATTRHIAPRLRVAVTGAIDRHAEGVPPAWETPLLRPRTRSARRSTRLARGQARYWPHQPQGAASRRVAAVAAESDRRLRRPNGTRPRRQRAYLTSGG